MFHYHFKCEGFYAYATNLTFLTYLIGRLDLIRFSLKNGNLSACLYLYRLCHHKLPNPVLTIKPVTGIEPVSTAWKAAMLAVTPHGH